MVTADAPASVVKIKKCPHCDFEYEVTNQGRGTYMAHVGKVHPDKTKKALEEKAAAAQEDKSTSQMTPRGEQFKLTLDTLGLRPGIATSMVSSFNRNASVLTSSRDKFRSWLLRYGLTRDQCQVLEDEMFGIEDDAPAAGGHPGAQPGQPVAYMPLPGGGYQPIFVSPGQQAPAAGPMVITLPGQPQGNGFDMAAFMAQQEASRQEFRETMLQIVAAITTKPEPEVRAVPMMRVPMMGADGHAVTDASGQTVYVEQPYTPGSEMMQMMGMMVGNLMNRPAAKEIDEEVLALKLEARLKSNQPPAQAISDDMRRIFDEQKAQLDLLGRELGQIREKDKFETLLDSRLGPLKAQLDEAKAMSGMSDNQFGLYHKERMSSNWQEFARSVALNATDQMKPLLVGPVTQALKSQGADPDTINRIVSQWLVPNAVGQLPAGAAGRFNAGKAAEMAAKWEK